MKSVTNEIVYKKEILDLVQSLVTINNTIIFSKSEDEKNVIVNQTDAEKSVAYILSAPIDYFNFPIDKVAFYNYNEFYQFYSMFKDAPNLSIDGIKLVMSLGNAKTEYILSSPETIESKAPKKIDIKEVCVKFNLTSEDLDEISKMNALIKAKRAKISGNEKELNIQLFSSMHENSYKNKFNVESINNFVGEYDFNIFSELFMKIPQKKNYTIEIKSSGFLKITLIDENISLNIFSGSAKS